MVINVPKNITDPIGSHSGLFEIIMGTTPIEAAAEVRNMGRILRFPERNAASNAV